MEALVLIKKNIDFIKYCLIGCSGAFLDFIIFVFLIKFIGINHYLMGNCISVTVGITNNFFLNAYLNFKTTDKIFLRFISFYFVGIIGLIISLGILYLMVDIYKYNAVFSKIVTIFVITVIQFLLNKFITFKKGEQ